MADLNLATLDGEALYNEWKPSPASSFDDLGPRFQNAWEHTASRITTAARRATGSYRPGYPSFARRLDAMLHPEKHPPGSIMHDPNHVYWESEDPAGFQWSAETIEWVAERVALEIREEEAAFGRDFASGTVRLEGCTALPASANFVFANGRALQVNAGDVITVKSRGRVDAETLEVELITSPPAVEADEPDAQERATALEMGAGAVVAGSDDGNGLWTRAADTIANVLLWAEAHSADPDSVLVRARHTFDRERKGR